MPLLDRSDLKHEYSWSTASANKPRSNTNTQKETKSDVFRPDEGDKMLSFLNQYAESRKILEKDEARNFEPLLRKKLEEEGEMTNEELEKWLDKQRKQ